jgi:hypothetical protein
MIIHPIHHSSFISSSCYSLDEEQERAAKRSSEAKQQAKPTKCCKANHFKVLLVIEEAHQSK